MFAADGSDKKSNAAHNHARELAAKLRDTTDKLKDKFPPSDFTVGAAALVFKLDEGVFPSTATTGSDP
jgi:hypothetical protein